MSRDFCDYMRRIHIVGVAPRTGTTLMTECMLAGFEIDSFDAHGTGLRAHRRSGNIYLTKSPQDLRIVGPRLRVDRHFNVIAMLRDPRDVVVSVHRADPRRYLAPLRVWKNCIPTIRRLRAHKRFVLIRYEDLVREPDAIQDMLAERMPFLRKKVRFSDFAGRRVAEEYVEVFRSLMP